MQDTIIIGAGIAGMTAAIYAARKRMDFLIFSSDFAGQMNLSNEVLNYPGIVKTTGIEFSTVLMEQMKFNGIGIKIEEVQGIEGIKNNNFRVITGKMDYETRSVIIATGARARKLGVPGEERLANKGVTYCAICDGPLFRDKKVAIIGGGNSALEAADFMLKIADRIYMIDSAEQLMAHESLIEKIKNNAHVEMISRARVKEILGKDFVEAIVYEKEGKIKKIYVKGVIVEAGRIPNTDRFMSLVKTDEHGHIMVDGWTNTSVEGIFAAGDCASGHEYQYIIAAGQGCMALLKAARYLAKKKG
ncbi:thioredoxin-disulfide reductase [Candidatus Woesearchaeota archaeon CG10_big_fil_rev_8_21_14_0_10_44_13]|nr:MAG: thioredoxin-disulfide reductase [Candidatus Woesearchaeota archaeon CG10_big_fil_rev_8_21_14_0_10_44_13]